MNPRVPPSLWGHCGSPKTQRSQKSGTRQSRLRLLPNAAHGQNGLHTGLAAGTQQRANDEIGKTLPRLLTINRQPIRDSSGGDSVQGALRRIASNLPRNVLAIHKSIDVG